MHILFAVKDLETEYLGIMYLSSVLKKSGHQVDIVEATYGKMKNKLKNGSFTLLAYTALSQLARYYLDLNRRIKEEFKIFSVFGGSHFTYFPEAIKEPGVDGVCIGEGEYALLDLADNLDAGEPITNIENWWIKSDGTIFQNPSRPLIRNLDDLPFPDRTLFSSRYPLTYITTSRGCPYRCSYCTEKNEFRQRSIANVIEELRRIKFEKQANFIYFVDSTFNSSLPWLRGFSEIYKKEIGLPFLCFVRADLVTPEIVRCLKNADCQCVSIGTETANEDLQDKIFKRKILKEQIISAAAIFKKAKIRLRISNIIGIPFSSLEDDLETLKFNILCRPDYAKANPLYIYRGSELYNFISKDPRFRLFNIPVKDYYLFVDTLDPYEAIKIKRLANLFGLVVGFPFLLPMIKFLLKLPFHRLGKYLDLIYCGFCSYFRLCDRRTGWRGFFIGFKRYMKMLMRA